MPERVLLIAEIGENHLGHLDLARRMIAEAAQAGADIVKFQSYRAQDVHSEDPEREWFAQVELTDAMHRELLEEAQRNRVEFLSAPFTVERAKFLCEELGLTRIKIASSEMLNLPLLDYVNERLETVFLSTGMSTLEEVRAAVGHLHRVPQLYLLHCVTQYPPSDGEVNLRAIPTLQSEFLDRSVGYSDHTIGVEAAVAAVALGASVIEKHFTLAKTLPGTDHVLSATPEEFAELVRRVRRVERLLGEGVKQPTPAERGIREGVRNRWRAEPSGSRSSELGSTTHSCK